MTISVLMSVYKSEQAEYLDRALKSVWSDQSLKPDEIVLIEDGYLTAELYHVIGNWSSLLSDKLVIVKNQENLGLTKSLNKGISVAKGDLIARMDSDDISDPLRFERQVKFMREHPDIDVLGGSLQEFDDSNKNLAKRQYPLTPAECRTYIAKASPLAHPTVMIRRKVFDSGIRYDERYRTSQDLALWFDLLDKHYNIANLEDVTIYFRRCGDVFKRRSRDRAFIEFRIYMNGIYRLNGIFTWKYIYPVSRLVFRLMPISVIKFVYESKLRHNVLK